LTSADGLTSEIVFFLFEHPIRKTSSTMVAKVETLYVEIFILL
jgi:hypothetical protein